MSRNRIIYANEMILVGPCPSSGYHFIDENSVLNNQYYNLDGNFNLLQHIWRIQNVSYTINNQTTSIAALGKKGTLARPIITSPSVDLNFSYLNYSILNETRLGMNCNYVGQDGTAIHKPNSGVFLLSGFLERNLITPNYHSSSSSSSPYYRNYISTDDKNIFVPTSSEGNDESVQATSTAHPSSKTMSVFSFGNCVMNSYRTSARVNEFPKIDVSYSCLNLMFSSSGSGVQTPAVESHSGLLIGQNYIIPAEYLGPTTQIPSVLRPGDILFDMVSLPGQSNVNSILGTGIGSPPNSNVSCLGFVFSDIKLQGFAIDLNLNREPLNSLGYRLPIDRQINFPLLGKLDMDFITTDMNTGSVSAFIRRNDDYNFSIKMKNPAYLGSEVACQYDILRAKFNNITYQNQIGGQKTANLSYTFSMDPQDLTQGMFISGKLQFGGMVF